jgi:hypothetical protein
VPRVRDEDIGAEPLPILNCRMACQFNSSQVTPMDPLGRYIQDALDLIQFANGDANTEWGRKRARDGRQATAFQDARAGRPPTWGPPSGGPAPATCNESSVCGRGENAVSRLPVADRCGTFGGRGS